MAETNRRKLRNVIVDRDLQFRILGGNLIILILGVIVILLVTLYPLVRNMDSQDLEVQYQSAQEFLIVVRWLVPAVILLVLLFALHLLVLTNRIFGPLFTFRRTFARIGGGDLSQKTHIRKGDYLKKESKEINEMIDLLSTLLSRVKTDQHRLILRLEGLLVSQKEKGAAQAGLEEIVPELLADARAVVEGLSKFKSEEEGPRKGSQ